ncbi:hypothetical protein YYE_04958 [Plasmodium vinckei vinckei]|uniref:CIR protein n=1 Tax=Plasmodium vinckei vinckei TaxID=54757 RepID=A0A081I931_PLAVN|nr:hypothetical protein YYE_04958 [Plasmodium vinckei vinckei]
MEKYQVLCEFLIKGDSYFNSKGVNTKKINNEPIIKGYCRDGSCKTNEDYINALIAYIIIKFKGSIKGEEYNTYDECLLMWISDKLFEIHNESKDKKTQKGYVDPITLNSAYEKYLEKHKVKGDYWVLFDHINGLKNANLRYMAEFYMLLNRICKTIVDYKDNGAKSSQLSKYSKKCLIQYRNLYLSISECNSYLHLLKKLKGIYDDFRVSAIEENRSNNNLATKLQTLTTLDGLEIDGTKSFILYKFPKKNCYSPKKKTDPPRSQGSSQAAGSENKENVEGTTQSVQKNGSDISKGTDAGTENSGGSVSGGGQGGNDGDKKSSDGTGDPVNVPDGGQNPTDSVPREKETQDASWPPFDIIQYIFRITLKGMDQINNAFKFFNGNKEKITKTINTINSLYNTSMSNIKTNFYNFIEFFNNYISKLNIDFKKVEIFDNSGDKNPVSKGTGDRLPTPNDSPPTQGNPSQTSSGTSNTSLSSPNAKEQTNAPQSPQGTPVNKNFDQTDQERPQKPVPALVTKKENIGTELKEDGITEIGDEYVLKEYKKIGLSIIVILIPITLTILHKYLASGWRKELTRKKNMKKVINSIGGKRQVQIIISSSSHKKQTKKSINSVYKEKSPSLNIYKLMQADPKA